MRCFIENLGKTELVDEPLASIDVELFGALAEVHEQAVGLRRRTDPGLDAAGHSRGGLRQGLHRSVRPHLERERPALGPLPGWNAREDQHLSLANAPRPITLERVGSTGTRIASRPRVQHLVVKPTTRGLGDRAGPMAMHGFRAHPDEIGEVLVVSGSSDRPLQRGSSTGESRSRRCRWPCRSHARGHRRMSGASYGTIDHVDSHGVFARKVERQLVGASARQAHSTQHTRETRCPSASTHACRAEPKLVAHDATPIANASRDASTDSTNGKQQLPLARAHRLIEKRIQHIAVVEDHVREVAHRADVRIVTRDARRGWTHRARLHARVWLPRVQDLGLRPHRLHRLGVGCRGHPRHGQNHQESHIDRVPVSIRPVGALNP